MSWYSSIKLSDDPDLQNLRNSLKSRYPGLELDVWLKPNGAIEVARIEVPKGMRNQGIGTAVMREIQEFAKTLRKPIVLSPEPDSRKKKKLDNFYRNLGFFPNKGRKADYQLTSPFAKTMLWKP